MNTRTISCCASFDTIAPTHRRPLTKGQPQNLDEVVTRLMPSTMPRGVATVLYDLQTHRV
ncbi:protein of unknown function (plasmid) [Cupriavidus neocaledonicus]|uniref:Uncharacterized protein n=1 Tax=Cupriavidus neocaledonicus TaxID=1040979 RepID=A0A375HMR9_9BURK|nr:hypothetical protein CBM2605_B130454 [Cupriavidus neocaledonicus]SPD59172.1 protein of unknown function [Cupriavidus neocaledonicus]